LDFGRDQLLLGEAFVFSDGCFVADLLLAILWALNRPAEGQKHRIEDSFQRLKIGVLGLELDQDRLVRDSKSDQLGPYEKIEVVEVKIASTRIGQWSSVRDQIGCKAFALDVVVLGLDDFDCLLDGLVWSGRPIEAQHREERRRGALDLESDNLVILQILAEGPVIGVGDRETQAAVDFWHGQR